MWPQAPPTKLCPPSRRLEVNLKGIILLLSTLTKVATCDSMAVVWTVKSLRWLSLTFLIKPGPLASTFYSCKASIWFILKIDL